MGAALGDLWVATNHSRLQNLTSFVRSVEEPSCDPIADSAEASPEWGTIAITIAQTLVQPASQSHQWRDWLLPEQSQPAHSGSDNGSSEFFESSAGWAIATLPLMLCYHDNFPALQSHLAPIAASARSNALVLGYTLGHILQNRLNPTTLIAQILTDLDLDKTDWVLADQLAEVQQLIRSGASLAIAHRVLKASTQFSSMPAMALALYCFLSTPDEYRLSLLLSTRYCLQPTLTGALVGALSGCMNTTAGLPINRRNSFQKYGTASLLLRSRWSVDTEAALLHVADLLLAHWAGVYHPTQTLPLTRQRWAIAAPDVIRPL